jgi:hypothetical protein
MSETTTCRVVIGMTNDGYTWRCGNPMPCVDHPAPPDAGRATETGHQAQWEAYERIARANGFWHHIEPWAAELTALRARLDASERVREAAATEIDRMLSFPLRPKDSSLAYVLKKTSDALRASLAPTPEGTKCE